MSILTVGTGQTYTTIESAVVASKSGDTINVNAGTYTNDFLGIYHNLTIQAVGAVKLVATVQPPNGKAIIDEGGSGVAVTLNGLDISGATVGDGNGAGVRYEGGTLVMNNDTVHGNQDGILANADANGAITINGSNFYGNGAGDGYTHAIYVGAVASLLVENSVISGTSVGHDIKSRAAATTITGNSITDATGTASYEIDLADGGVGVITNNVIEKGPNASNPIAISYGEEGVGASNSLLVSGNTLVNDLGRTTIAVANHTSVTASVVNNKVYGFSTLVSGPATTSGNVTLSSEPALTVPTGTVPTGTTTTGTVPTGTTTTTPVSTPVFPAGAVVNYIDTTKFAFGQLALVRPTSGTPSYIAAQYIWSSPDSVALANTTPSVFLQTSSGNDAIQVASGSNVLDGGRGSNFLVGGTGADTFYSDARGGGVVWDTVVHFHAGDSMTLWGFVAGTSSYAWDSAVSGTAGFTGGTLRASIAGHGTDASVTFAGLSVAQAQGLSVTTGTSGGVGFILIKA